MLSSLISSHSKFYGGLFFIFISCCCVDAWACGCVVEWPSPTMDEEWRTERTYDKSDVVFTGKSLSKELSQSSQPYTNVTTLNVVKVFKGDVSKKQFQIYQGYAETEDSRRSLLTGEVIMNCDYNFQEGEEYLVYGKYHEEKLTTDKCVGTKLIAEASKNLEILEKIIATPNWKFDESKMPTEDLFWGK